MDGVQRTSYSQRRDYSPIDRLQGRARGFVRVEWAQSKSSAEVTGSHWVQLTRLIRPWIGVGMRAGLTDRPPSHI